MVFERHIKIKPWCNEITTEWDPPTQKNQKLSISPQLASTRSDARLSSSSLENLLILQSPLMKAIPCLRLVELCQCQGRTI